MESLVEQGRYVEAFNLGLRHESLAGEPRYDYYFGVASIESGRAALGVLALERVLLANPENDLARLELARSYFIVQDFERSKNEFGFLLGKQLPASLRESVQKYLAAIREESPEFGLVLRAYAEYAFGRYSRMNASAGALVPVPYVFAQLFLEPVPVQATTSDFGQLAAGVSATGPVVPVINYILAFDSNFRQPASVNNDDRGAVGLTGGLEFAGGRDR